MNVMGTGTSYCSTYLLHCSNPLSGQWPEWVWWRAIRDLLAQEASTALLGRPTPNQLQCLKRCRPLQGRTKLH